MFTYLYDGVLPKEIILLDGSGGTPSEVLLWQVEPEEKELRLPNIPPPLFFPFVLFGRGGLLRLQIIQLLVGFNWQ